MSNTFAPNGLVAVRRQDGASWSGNMTVYKIAAADTNKFFSGDPVHRLSTGYVTSGDVTTGGIIGIFVGCEYLSTSQNKVVWNNQYAGADAAADITAYVIDDPSVILQVWAGTGASPGTAGSLLFADIGANINFKTGAGNSLSGLSTTYVDASTKTTTNTLPFQIVGFASLPPGVNGSDTLSSGALVEVVFNQMQTNRVGNTGI